MMVKDPLHVLSTLQSLKASFAPTHTRTRHPRKQIDCGEVNTEDYKLVDGRSYRTLDEVPTTGSTDVKRRAPYNASLRPATSTPVYYYVRIPFPLYWLLRTTVQDL